MSMEFVFGLKCDKFVLLAGDKCQIDRIVMSTVDRSKLKQLGKKAAMVTTGEDGDSDQFAEYIEANLKLYRMRNRYELSPKSAAHFVRRTIADAIRSDSPYLVHLIIGGFDQSTGGSYLSSMDYMGNQFEPKFAMFGYGGRFCHSVMDQRYRKDFTEAEAIETVKVCFDEIQKRYAINFPKFSIAIIDADGVKEIQ